MEKLFEKLLWTFRYAIFVVVHTRCKRMHSSWQVTFLCQGIYINGCVLCIMNEYEYNIHWTKYLKMLWQADQLSPRGFYFYSFNSYATWGLPNDHSWLCKKKQAIMYFVHSSQKHRQTIISHCKHFPDAWVSALNLNIQSTVWAAVETGKHW